MNRKDARVQERRARSAQLYLEGHVQREIAALLGVRQQLVSDDLQWAMAQWQTQTAEHVEAKKALHRARIEHTLSELWAAWYASKAPREITETEATEEGGPPRRRAKVRKEGSWGDTRYMTCIQKALDQLAALDGLNAPSHVRVDLDSLAPDQLRRLAMGEPLETVMRTPVAEA